MEIRGQRITLRPITMDDLDVCTRWAADPEVMRHVIQETKTADEEKEWLENALQDKDHKVLIICDENMKPIGTCGIHFIATDPSLRNEEGLSIGIMIGEKSAWGKGYGPEVMTVLSEHVYKEYGTNRVWLTVDTVHTRAIQAYKKAGFIIVREVHAPQRIHSEGRQLLMEKRF